MGGPDRRRISSGTRWEQPFGYSRAVIIGDRCLVSGTTDPSGRHPGDAAGQARETLRIVATALTGAGFTLADVVRTRMYVTRAADAEARQMPKPWRPSTARSSG
jgi:enamine deaminase RidA (YjgF/YER057c/UK114 family)